MASESEKFVQEMRSEWNALRVALCDAVELHFHKQEKMIHELGTARHHPLNALAPAASTDQVKIAAPARPAPPCRPPPTLEAGARSRPRVEVPRDRSLPTVPPDEASSPCSPGRPAKPKAGDGESEMGSPRRPGKAAEADSEADDTPRRQASKAPSVASHASKVSEGWEDMEHAGFGGAIRRKINKKCFKCINWWSELREPERSGRLYDFVHGTGFESLCACVIIGNGIFATITSNMEEEAAFQGRDGRPTSVLLGEMFFLIFYCVELGLKLACHGLYFFCNDDMEWNCFDSSLVAFTLYDEACSAIFQVSMGANVTFMRSLRILKMAKILRVVRVMKYFAELRLILQSLVGSLASLFWSIVMLALIFYIFALCFVQGMTSHLLDTADAPQSESRLDIMTYFGTVQDTMLTLYKASTGGDDWSAYYNIVATAGGMYATLFIFFIAFIQIALFNILTAIFVENAMKLAQPDRDAKALELRKAEVAEKEELRRICKALDVNNDGRLDVEEFARAIMHGRLKAYLGVLGLDVRDAEVFLKVLSSAAKDEPIEIDSFVEGCMRMKGYASSIDMQGLMFETKIIHKTLDRFNREVNEQLLDLSYDLRSSYGVGMGVQSYAYMRKPEDSTMSETTRSYSGGRPDHGRAGSGGTISGDTRSDSLNECSAPCTEASYGETGRRGLEAETITGPPASGYGFPRAGSSQADGTEMDDVDADVNEDLSGDRRSVRTDAGAPRGDQGKRKVIRAGRKQAGGKTSQVVQQPRGPNDPSGALLKGGDGENVLQEEPAPKAEEDEEEVIEASGTPPTSTV